MRRTIAVVHVAARLGLAGIAGLAVTVPALAQQPWPGERTGLPQAAPLPPTRPTANDGPASAPTVTGTTSAQIAVRPVEIKRNARTSPDITQRATIERVNSYFNSIRTLVGDFVQVNPDGGRTEGQFYLQKPGRIRFNYKPPNPTELISDGSSVAVRDRKLATQDLYPLSQTPLRFLLADKIDLVKDTNLVGVYEDDLFITIVIEEKHAVVGTHRLMIMFGAEDSQLKQWTVTDPQGFDTTVAVYNLDPSKKPDPRLFRINYERMHPTPH